MSSLSDKVHAFEAVAQDDLHAYVDGLLDEPRARAVRDYLKRHPHKAEQVSDYMAYNELLRELYNQPASEPVPLRLLSVLDRPARSIWPAFGKVVAVTVLCVLSAGVGWLGAHQVGAGSTGQDGMVRNFLQQIAANAQTPFDELPVQKLEINTQARTDPLNWLTQRVALEMQAPNLSQAGYTLSARRLVTRGQQEFVELKYINSSQDAVFLYMKTRWEKDAPTIEFVQKDRQSIAYWQEGPLVYALAGSIDHERAAAIADLVRQSMTSMPNEQHPAQDVRIISAEPVRPADQTLPPRLDQPVPLTEAAEPPKLNAVGTQF